ARNLVIENAVGDPTLRSNMNWDAIKNDDKTKKVLKHW
ncbi:MAG: alpha-amylase, partial [Psychroserpens sp.]